MTGFFRRSIWATRLLVCGLMVAFTWATCGVSPSAARAALRGAPTPDAAARGATAREDPVLLRLAGWRPNADAAWASEWGDTTDVEFPEEEEQKRSHLYRDIGIFVVVSAFVGYFIVKVFLEGDTDETPPPKKGKDYPGS